MKKIIATTLILVILIVATTGAFVVKLKKDFEQYDKEVSKPIIKNDKLESKDDEINEIVKEKTLDLYGTYNQNDLLLVEKEFGHELLMSPISIKQISGLKDKNVEDKINSDIEEKIIKALNEISELYDDDKLYVSSYGKIANFSNVLSIPCYVVANNKSGEKFNTYINLNYNLINGEEIKFKDLFIEDADIQTMIRSALYRKNEEMKAEREYGEDYGWYDENNKGPESLSENEISKIVQDFAKGEDFLFSFTPWEVSVHESEEFTIKFEDFADMVTIYDKYLTEESLYEKDNIGVKNIVTCSREIFSPNTFLYKKAAYESENFFYDIRISDNLYYGGEKIKEYIKPQLDECMNIVNQKLEYYRTLAKNNPNQMYIAYIYPTISVGTYYSAEYYNLVSINYSEKIISGDITEKDELLYKVYGLYRYPNLNTDQYGGNVYRAVSGVSYDDYCFKNFEQNENYMVFDLITGKSIENVGDLFKEGVDYTKLIKDILKKENKYTIERYYDNGRWVYRTEEEIEEMLSKIKYTFDANIIYVTIDEDLKYYGTIDFSSSDIWQYLKLQKFKQEDIEKIMS